ncbi:MAG: peptidylprolyl isomerase [Bdellovibrionales bacterium]|nr:peptidylprolyl isomerase [Bdellovibrionales bacterium]
MLRQQFVLSLVLFCLGFKASADVVAKVGKKTITTQDFNAKYDEIKKQTINPPPPELFLEDLIRYEIGVQEAEAKGLRNDPIVLERINQELYKVLVEKAIGDKVKAIKVTEEEMKAQYKKNPDFRISHILIEFKPTATEKEKEEARKHGEEILREVKASKRPFEELVKLYSDDSISKENGGDIGFQSKVTLLPPIYDTVVKMTPGEIKGLVETRYGFHILKLNERGRFQNANKQHLRAATFDEKRKAIFDEYFANIKKKYKIESNPKLVKNLK